MHRHTLTYILSKYILILMHTSPSLMFAYYGTKFIFAKLITLKIPTTIRNQLSCCLYHPTYQKIFRVKVLHLTRGLYFVLYILSCKMNGFWVCQQNYEKRLLAASCPSVCQDRTIRLSLDGFSRCLIFEFFFKIYQKN